MLGNCIFRNPSTRDGKLDKGSLCEALLFFEKGHLLIDMATLASMVESDFLDILVVMLKEGYLTANYSPQAAVLYTDNKNGIREHSFTIARFGGDQRNPNMRNPELMEQQLARLFGDKAKARKYYRMLADLISFDDLEDNGVPTLSRDDICDPNIAGEVARSALRHYGVPEEEIRFSRIDVMPLDGFKFAISSDIDFERIRQFLPEPDRSAFGQNNLFPSIGDARLDIGLAAKYNAAFVGNEKNAGIISMILHRSLGVQFDPEKRSRQIYDFISVAVPSIREVINSGERTTEEFVKLIEKAEAFRKWLNKQSPNADLIREMLREKASASWLESLPVKAMRFGLFTGGGTVADFFVPGASLAAGAADTFLIERLGKSWRPHYFVENDLRGFLEK
jgi:hypothetical protein